MTSVTKDFVAKIAVGLRGVAILELTETISPHSVYVGSDIHPELILHDVDMDGIEEWADCYLDDKPTKPGIYTFRGSVRFGEDSADYSMTCDDA
jgi:hypothetical protein